MHSYSHQHVIPVRLLNLACLQCRCSNLFSDILQYVNTITSHYLELVTCKRVLKHRDDISNLNNFSRVFSISLQIVYHELIQYSCHNLPLACPLPNNVAILESLPVELLRQLKISIPAFKEPKVYNILHARCT